MSNMSNMARDTAKDAQGCRQGNQQGRIGRREGHSGGSGSAARRRRAPDAAARRASWPPRATRSGSARQSNVEGVISDAQDKGMEAVGAVREVGDNVVDAIDESLKQAPVHDARARRRHRLPVRRDVAAVDRRHLTNRRITSLASERRHAHGLGAISAAEGGGKNRPQQRRGRVRARRRDRARWRRSSSLSSPPSSGWPSATAR